MLDGLITEGGKLNTLISEKADILCKMNTETSAVHCLPELPNMTDVLKISQQNELVEPPIEPPVDLIVSAEEEMMLENVEEPVNVHFVIQPVETDPNAISASNIPRVCEEIINFKHILYIIWKSIILGAKWLYNLQLARRIDINNFNNGRNIMSEIWEI